MFTKKSNGNDENISANRETMKKYFMLRNKYKITMNCFELNLHMRCIKLLISTYLH